MSESAQLLTILRRVRRRLRALLALQGAVVGALVATSLSAVAVALWRWRGEPMAAAGALVTLVGLGLVLAGALAFALRRVTLARCARTLDRSLDLEDRFFSALAFTTAHETPFTRAAMADAVARGRDLAPQVVAPLRRPRGLVALAASVVALVVAGVVPVPSPAGGNATAAAAASRPERPLRIDPADLEAERDEARLAEKAAAELGDAGLSALAAALQDAVRDLTNGTVPRGEALDRLAELQRRADELAAEAEELGRGLERAAATMKEPAITRAVGAALAAKDPTATEKAVSALAEQAAAAGGGERRALAQTLSEAAAQAAGAANPSGAGSGERSPGQAQDGAQNRGQSPASGQPASDEEPQRRLARERQSSPLGADDAATARSGERRLQRLQRELNEAAAACRENPESCRRKLRDSARELPRMENEARSQEWRRRLSAAARQLRERLRRDPAGNRDALRQRAERQFTRAARGKGAAGGKKGEGSSGQERPVAAERGDPGDDGDIELEMDSSGGSDEELAGASAGDDSAGGMTAEGAGAMTAEGAGAESGEGKDVPDQNAPGANGQGIGNQAGGDPLGKRDSQTTRGREREAPVRSGAGPTRAQVIEAAAARGFARGGYQDVFQDYQAVVEESLDATDVPPGRRYVVRRYFQLIRPRSTGVPQSKSPSRSTRSK